jgi:glycosyl transferase family 87
MPRIRSSISRNSFLPTELRGPLLAGAAVFVVAWLFVSYVPAFSVWLVGDVRFYETWGNLLANHHVPYRDFQIEYPPGALPMFMGPVYLRKLSGYYSTYYFWFRIELLVIGLLVVVAMAYALARLGASRRRAYAALCFAGAGPALLGPIALARFDYWPALLAVAAVAALVARRPMVACGFAGAGTAVKIFPAVLIPLALIELWRRQGARAAAKGLALALAVIGALALPFAVVAPHGVSWALHRQFSRPLQVESLGAAFFAAAHVIAGVHLHVVKRAGSDNLVGSGPHLASTLSSVLTLLGPLAVYALYLRSEGTRDDLAAASVAAVTAYVAFSKVFSPQYLVWLIPLVPLVGGRRGLRASILLFTIVGMTQIWEPYRYGDYYRTFAPWLTWLVVVRDLLVVALLAVLLRPSGRDADELDSVRPAVV